MNFLFTVALNNNNGNSYKSIMQLFRNLAITLEELGHKTFVIANPASYMHYDPYTSVLQSESLTKNNYDSVMKQVKFKPDYAFVWNGNTLGDMETIKLLKSQNIKMIYGELGFFDHYNKTCYFDLSGVNCRIVDIASPISHDPLSETEESSLKALHDTHVKPRLHEEPFIFVPLQVETDTQIVKYSPFKTMDELLEYISDIFKNDNRTILYKQHPLHRSSVKKYNNMIEVIEDVHHYIPYADSVVGINSTVLTETLIYHNRLIGLGAGIISKHFVNDNQRKRYVLQLNDKQLNWSDLIDKEKIEASHFYQQILKDYNKL